MDSITKKTAGRYDFLWSIYHKLSVPAVYHFNHMQQVIPEKIVRGNLGLDLGCGCGWDTFIMAKNNPLVRIVGMDISDGVVEAKRINLQQKNVWVIKGSVLNTPIKNNVFDFIYSFGVLHHIPDPEQGLRETLRVLKKNAPLFLYLYEDHSENRIKNLALKIIKILRRITTKIPTKVLYIISYLLSPFIMILFCYPARIFNKVGITKSFSEKIPFNFAGHPFSLAGDLYDRFSVPLEHRFSREEVFKLLNQNNIINIKIDRLKSKSGWVIWGYKSNA